MNLMRARHRCWLSAFERVLLGLDDVEAFLARSRKDSSHKCPRKVT
jgi:hypothetical protein